MQTSVVIHTECICWNARSKRFDIHDVPENVWIRIMTFCSLRDVLSMEQTCTFLRRLASSKTIWTKHLRELDQARAPDLHPKQSINALTGMQLRQIVAGAIQRHNKCTGNEELTMTIASVLPLIQDADRENHLGKLSDWGSKILLLPGRQHLLIKRPRGFLQVMDISARNSLSISPHHISDIHQEKRIHVLRFDYDIRDNGDIFFLVLSELTDENVSPRIVEIFSYSPFTFSLSTVHRQAPPQLEERHGVPIFAGLHGDIVAIYIESRLMLLNWLEGQLLTIDDIVLDDMMVLDDHLVCVRDLHGAKSLIALPLSRIICQAQNYKRDLHIRFADLQARVLECQIAPPDHWTLGRGMLSVCPLHWRTEEDRDSISISILVELIREADFHFSPAAYTFILHSHHDTSNPGEKCNKSSHETLEPRLVALGCSMPDDVQPRFFKHGSYSVLSPPCQFGATVIAFDEENFEQDNSQPSRMLTVFPAGGQPFFKPINSALPPESPPATRSLYVEQYSGTLYYYSAESHSIVMLSFV